MGRPFPPLKIAPSHGGSGPPSDTWFPGPSRVLNPNGISMTSPFLQGSLVWQTDWQTDHTIRSVTTGRTYGLWHCWLGGRKGIGPVKIWVVRYWHGYLSGARCKWFAYGTADATATPSSLAPKNAEWFTFLVPAYPGCPGKRPLNGCSSSTYVVLRCDLIIMCKCTFTLHSIQHSGEWCMCVYMVEPGWSAE